MTNARVVCIQGPTASGKSDLAEELALRFDGEIVSADSMQIYTGMDIGTAKVAADRRRVPYHCIDILSPGEPYSAALFQTEARAAFDQIGERDKLPILCGGTGFYVRAALDDMDFAAGEQGNNPVREKYEALLAELGAEGLHELLAEKDAESAAMLHANDTKRVVRALEMFEAGDSYARRKQNFKTIPPKIPAVKIALSVDREILYDKINRRVDIMVELGLVDEVRSLLDQGFRNGLTAPQAIGYKEIVAHFDGACTLDEAIEQIKQSSRRYAKRQMTWLRCEKNVHWIECNSGITESVIETASELVKDGVLG